MKIFLQDWSYSGDTSEVSYNSVYGRARNGSFVCEMCECVDYSIPSMGLVGNLATMLFVSSTPVGCSGPQLRDPIGVHGVYVPREILQLAVIDSPVFDDSSSSSTHTCLPNDSEFSSSPSSSPSSSYSSSSWYAPDAEVTNVDWQQSQATINLDAMD